MSTTYKERYEVMQRLERLGVSYDDAQALRRIAMTLHRWFEIECNGEIDRDEVTGVPYHHYGRGTKGPFLTVKAVDRETGARKRLAAILAKYPSLHAYVQTDPRGAALYILTAEQITYYDNKPLDEIYNNGVAVY